jgi:hypothetical protein
MSRRKSRFQEQQAKKDRRTKIVAVGAAVVLAAILAFELPHYLGGHKSSAVAAGTATTPSDGTSSSTTAATTTPSTAALGTPTAAAVPTTGNTKLPNSDAAPIRTKSQLYSFGRFAGKDPFVQQVSEQPVGAAPTSSSSSAPSSGSSAPSSGSSTGTTSSVQQTAARTLTSRGLATISVNGKREVVRVGESFPSANPVFKLVSLTNGAINIGIANGSYTSGVRTVRLASARSLTLVDTADGVRYRLRLLSAS